MAKLKFKDENDEFVAIVQDVKLNNTSVFDGKEANINAVVPSDIINNVTSTATNKPLSANMGKELQDEINNLQARGRFLALWNCSTGLAESNPTTSPYTYKTGDYFIVGTVATSPASNYRPNGSSYTTGTASTTVETSEVNVDDVYYYDGSVWKLQSNSQKTLTFANIAGQPTDNTNLANALNERTTKVDILLSNTPDQEGFIHSKYTPAELWTMYNQADTFLTINGQLIADAHLNNAGDFSCAILLAEEKWTPIYVRMYTVRYNDENRLRVSADMPAASADFTINGHKLSDNYGTMLLDTTDLAYANTIKGTAVTTAKGALDTLTTNVNALSTVEANPTLAGTESDLTALEVAGTKYKIPSGGSGGGNTTTIQTSWSTMPQNPNVGDRVTNVNDNSGTPGGGNFTPVIDVIAPVGTTITVTDGTTTFTRTSTEEVTRFDIPSWGTWTVSATIDSLPYSQTVVVDTVKIYEVGLGTLPSIYKEVLYLESTGTQYIDTGVIPSSDMQCIAKIKTDTFNSNKVRVLGAYESVGGIAYRCYMPSYYYSAGNQYSINFGRIDYDSSYSGASVLGLHTFDVHYTTSSQEIKMDDNTIYTGTTATTIGFVNNPLYIFALNNGTTSNLDFTKTKLYSCVIKSQSSTVREFVPCYRIADNEPGLYDLVNHRFYTNDGTGTFNVGPDVNQGGNE